MEPVQKYSMKWNSYQKHVGSYLSTLYESKILTDVTLWAENKKFSCHRIILSACSPYFQEILSNIGSEHPVILLSGIYAEDVKTIMHFIYHGEVDNVAYDRFISVLKTAEMLKICGLTEVIDHIPPKKCLAELEEMIMMNDTLTTSSPDQLQGVELSATSEDIAEKKQQKPKKCQRKYSEGSLDWALNDMEKGMSLIEAAKLHKIPRSTLYAKAKQHSGLTLASRKEHTTQDCQAAIQAVAGGLSLKRASEQYGIPKTVLWRRVQKRLDICSNLKSRRKNQERDNFKFQEDGKTMQEVIEGNIELIQSRSCEQSHCYENELKTINDDELHKKNTKQFRLAQALNACKEGKMSQALASRTFQVPKTLIWRRLQKEWSISKKNENTESGSQMKTQISKENDTQYTHVFSDVDNYVTLSSEADRNDTDMKEKQLNEAPIIILTSTNEILQKQDVNDEELLESLNVGIENVVEVVSDKDEVPWS